MAGGRYSTGTTFAELLLGTRRGIVRAGSGAVAVDAADPSLPPSITNLQLTAVSVLDTYQGQHVSLIKATWDSVEPDVSEAADADVSPVTDYLTSYATGDTGWSREGGTGGVNAVTLPPLPTGIPVTVRVRARTAAGALGPFTTASITTSRDEEPPPVPSAPTAIGTLRGLAVLWDGTFAAGAARPADFAYVVAEVSLTADFAQIIRGGELSERGMTAVTRLTDGTPFTAYARLVAVDHSGNRSAASASVEAGSIPVVAADIGGGAVTTAKLAEAAVTAEKILNGAVDTLKLATGAVTGVKLADLSVTVGKIVDGAVTAAKTDLAALDNDLGALRAGTVAAAQLVAGAVTEVALATGAVTAAKTNVAALDQVLGNLRADTVAAAQIVAGAVTEAKVAAGAITETKVGAGAISTPKLVAGAVTAEKITAGAVTTDKITAGAITAEKVAAGAVTADKIAAGSVTAVKIEAGAITSEKIAAGSITSEKIAAGTVVASEVAAGSITTDKLAAGAVTTEKLSAGSVVAEKISAGAITSTLIASNAILANHIVAGQVMAEKIAASAVTAEKINAFAVTTEKLNAGAVETGKIATNSITSSLIAAGAVTADELAADAITGKTITGGVLTTGVYGQDRVELRDETAYDYYLGYYRSIRDTLRWVRGYDNAIVGEIRGYMGDIGAYGLHLNSNVELGNTQSVIYQVGKRHASNPNSNVRVRAGYFQAYTNLGDGTIDIWFGSQMSQAPTFVVLTPEYNGVSGDSIGFLKVRQIYSDHVHAKARYDNGTIPGNGTLVTGYYYAELVV